LTTPEPELMPASPFVAVETRFAILFLCCFLPMAAHAGTLPASQLSTFGAGNGPSFDDGTYRLLDGTATPGQSNVIAFANDIGGAFEKVNLRCRLRVRQGGHGGGIALLNSVEFGSRGPGPFVENWAEPNLAGSFAVGIDIHNPPTDDPYDQWGNILGMPEREVSLHWDGREIANRFVPVEFRGDFVDLDITIRHLPGGTEVSVHLAGKPVYEKFFLAGMLPYESRLAIGASTHGEATTEFDVRDMRLTRSKPASPRRPPLVYKIFNHVLTDHEVTGYRQEVELPPLDWAFGRIILTLEIHDAGRDWDPWDRNGSFSVIGAEGVKYDIAPFITSFRTAGRWEVDLTPFRPWLTGEVSFEIATSSTGEKDHGFMLSASLAFYHGAPDLVPFRVIPLWNGMAQYGSAANPFGEFFRPREVSIDQTTRAVRLLMTTTGHSPVGEFTTSRRRLILVPDKNRGTETMQFENLLWKTDNYLNPVRPQKGTWKYSRAGWAPGDVVRPWQIDLTPYLLPGQTAELRYEAEPYDFSARPEDQRPTTEEINQAVHLVRSYLILYRPPMVNQVPAPAIEVLEVLAGENAERNGIEAGDYLLSYDGQLADTIDELQDMIRSAKSAGRQRIEVVVYRGGRRLTLDLDPGRMGVRIAEGITGL